MNMKHRVDPELIETLELMDAATNGGIDLLDRLLDECPDVTVLITSREVLRLKREDFEGIIDDHPQLAYKVMRAVVRSAHRIVEDVVCGVDARHVVLDQRVAGRPAADAGHALAFQPQGLAVLGARRNADIQRLAVGQLGVEGQRVERDLFEQRHRGDQAVEPEIVERGGDVETVLAVALGDALEVSTRPRSPEGFSGAVGDLRYRVSLEPETIADVRASIAQPGQLGYTQLTPLRKPTLKRKITQLREAGVVFQRLGEHLDSPLQFSGRAAPPVQTS